MAIYTKEEARRIMEKALSFSTADSCEISLGGSESGNIRYARNSVSTSGYRSNQNLSITSSYGKNPDLPRSMNLTMLHWKKW